MYVYRDEPQECARTELGREPVAPRPGDNPGPLPRYLTTFIGRRRELADVQALLQRDDVRLVTLAGPGGVGKTRLAVEVTSRIDEGFRDGVTFIPLASVRDPALVIPAISQALGLLQVSRRPHKETLIRFLRDRHQLLLIDNFEAVTEAASELAEILERCSSVSMLVTSRIVLRVSGEHVFRVYPLTLPKTSSDHSMGYMEDADAIRLFVDRARLASPTFELSPENAPTVARICQALDALPLALELAAARTTILSPASLLSLLRNRSSVLAEGPRDVPERHRSMREAIAWSYDLLTPSEQRAFRQLSVFDGGFTIAAAQAGTCDAGDMFQMISSLATQSLVVPVESQGEEPRFTILETLREFGREHLASDDEETAVRACHAAWFEEVAARGEYAWAMPLDEGMKRLGELRTEHANLREALRWLYQSGETDQGLRMVANLVSLWIVGGHLDEGQLWHERFLARSEAFHPNDHARALKALAWISNQQGAGAKAFRLVQQALAIFRTLDEPRSIVECLTMGAIIAARNGDLVTVTAFDKEATERIGSIDGPDWIQNWKHTQLVHLGMAQLLCGDIDRADKYWRQAIELGTSRGYVPGTTHILGSHIFAGPGLVAQIKGDFPEALRHHQAGLGLAWRSRNVRSCIHAIGNIAGVLAGAGNYAEAARLFGASESFHEQYGYSFSETIDWYRAIGLPEPWAREGETLGDAQPLRNAFGMPTALLGTLDPEPLATIWAEGRTLSLEHAVHEALQVQVTEEPDTAPSHSLSPRELDVLRLIVEGSSNRDIAEALFLSERTITTHIDHIFTKLGVESRTAAAIFAVRNRLVE